MSATATLAVADLDEVLTEIASAWSAAREYQRAIEAEGNVLTAYASARDHGAPAGELDAIRATLTRVVDRRCRAVEALGAELGILPYQARSVAIAGRLSCYRGAMGRAAVLPGILADDPGDGCCDDPTCPCGGEAADGEVELADPVGIVGLGGTTRGDLTQALLERMAGVVVTGGMVRTGYGCGHVHLIVADGADVTSSYRLVIEREDGGDGAAGGVS